MKLVEMTAAEVRAAAPVCVALLPTAAIEQHGPHLAVSTDAAIVTAVAEAVEARLPAEVVLCPAQVYGSSHHHRAFGGTLSLSPDLFSAVVGDLIRCLRGTGFTRILILNGHGGNIAPIGQALSTLAAEFSGDPRPLIAAVSYWDIGGPLFHGADPMETPALTHACEYETSLMLHLHPGRVHPERVRPHRRMEGRGYLHIEAGDPATGIRLPLPFDYYTSTGNLGRPELASAAKGEKLLAAVVDALVRFLSEYKDWPLPASLRQDG